jgi:hypothetical protein
MAETLVDYPSDTVHVACEMCPRRVRYRKAALIDRYGAGTALPDVLRQLAGKCWGRENWSSNIPPCGAYFCDLGSRDR